MLPHVTFLLCIVAIALCRLTSAEVIPLSDATFEHQTQATTGSTTGSWLILFQTTTCHSCATVKSTLERLAEEEEELYARGIVIGSVDVESSPSTATRFSITSVPTLVYLHQGRLYRYQASSLDGDESAPMLELIKDFVLGDLHSVTSENIPAASSYLDEMTAVYHKVMSSDESGFLGYAILGMCGLLGGTIIMLLVSLLRRPTKKAKGN